MNSCIQNNSTKPKTCIICGRDYVGKGFDASLIKRGMCCKECYIKNIIPTRNALKR